MTDDGSQVIRTQITDASGAQLGTEAPGSDASEPSREPVPAREDRAAAEKDAEISIVEVPDAEVPSTAQASDKPVAESDKTDFRTLRQRTRELGRKMRRTPDDSDDEDPWKEQFTRKAMLLAKKLNNRASDALEHFWPSRLRGPGTPGSSSDDEDTDPT